MMQIFGRILLWLFGFGVAAVVIVMAYGFVSQRISGARYFKQLIADPVPPEVTNIFGECRFDSAAFTYLEFHFTGSFESLVLMSQWKVCDESATISTENQSRSQDSSPTNCWLLKPCTRVLCLSGAYHATLNVDEKRGFAILNATGCL